MPSEVFPQDMEMLDAVFEFVWSSGSKAERTMESMERAESLIQRIKNYRDQISGDFGSWRYQDRVAFLNEQVEKVERWKAGE